MKTATDVLGPENCAVAVALPLSKEDFWKGARHLHPTTFVREWLRRFSFESVQEGWEEICAVFSFRRRRLCRSGTPWGARETARFHYGVVRTPPRENCRGFNRAHGVVKS